MSTSGDNHPCYLPVVCRFPDGATEALLLVRLTLADAFLLTMKPPEVGTPVTILLGPLRGTVPPPIEARVIGARIDPSDAASSGFEVVFTDIDDETLSALARASEFLEKSPFRHAGREPRRAPERREYPRVNVKLTAQAEVAGAISLLELRDISMSGALLLAHRPQLLSKLQVGDRFYFSIVTVDPSEPLAIPARIVRMVQEQPMQIAVRFLDMDASTERSLNNLILYSAIAVGFPGTAPRAPLESQRSRR